MKYKYQTEQEAICTTCEENRKVLYEYDGLKKTCPRCLLVHLSCDFDISKIKALKFLTVDILFDRIAETSTKKLSWFDVKTMVNNNWSYHAINTRYENTKIISIFRIVNQMIIKLQGEKFNFIGCKFCQNALKILDLEKLPCCKIFTCYACLTGMDRTNKKCQNCGSKLYASSQHRKKVICNLAAYTLKFCEIIPTPKIEKEVEKELAQIFRKNHCTALQKITVEDLAGQIISEITQRVKEREETLKNRNSEYQISAVGVLLSAITQHGFLYYFNYNSMSNNLVPDFFFIQTNIMFSMVFSEKVLMPIEKLERQYNCILPIEAHQERKILQYITLWLGFVSRVFLHDSLQSDSILMSIYFRFLIFLSIGLPLYYFTPIVSDFKMKCLKHK